MKTPEEIKKGLECCSYNGRCDDCPYNVTVEGAYGTEELGCDDNLQPDALAYIQQLEAQVPRWISVEERMPEEPVVLVSICGYITVAWHRGNGRFETGSRLMLRNGEVHYWMPLPEAPEEVQHEAD